jgi:pimeloyl-ACP methyl ester carboxylesterase
MKEEKIIIDKLSINYNVIGQGLSFEALAKEEKPILVLPPYAKVFDPEAQTRRATEDKIILILHGWGKGSEAWVQAGEILAKNSFQVIIPDLPGFGKSEEPKNPWKIADYVKFIENFVATLGIDKFDLIGHSFGGGLAAVYAAQKPQKVSKLILCDSAIVREKRLSLRQKIAQGLAKTGKSVFTLPLSGGLLHLAQKIVYKIAGVHDYQLASPLMKKIFLNISGQDLRDYASQIQLPTLIIWGENDKSTALGDARALNRMITGSKLEIIKGAGHNPHQTHSKELIKIISQFIQS